VSSTDHDVTFQAASQASDRCGLLLHMLHFPRLSICLCVGHTVSCGKTTEPVEMLLQRQTCVGQTNHALDVGAHWRHMAKIRPYVALLWLLDVDR